MNELFDGGKKGKDRAMCIQSDPKRHYCQIGAIFAAKKECADGSEGGSYPIRPFYVFLAATFPLCRRQE